MSLQTQTSHCTRHLAKLLIRTPKSATKANISAMAEMHPSLSHFSAMSDKSASNGGPRRGLIISN